MANPLIKRSRRLDVVSWTILILAALWLAIPSSVFIWPKAMIYDGRIATLQRETPFGPVYTEWNREMYVSGTHMECHAPARIERHQKVPGDLGDDGNPVGENTVTWIEGDWAIPCLRAEPPIIVTNTWRVLLFGIVPLRPTQLVTTIEKSLSPCDRVRVSTNGRYHTPDSPWYSRVVAPIACFETAEEAETAGYVRAE